MPLESALILAGRMIRVLALRKDWPSTMISCEANRSYFYPYQPDGTTGLARRLNPQVHYLACRWDYDVTPARSSQEHKALVTSRRKPE